MDRGTITTDAGGLWRREGEKRTGIIAQFAAACFRDQRDPVRIEHGVKELVAQRVEGLALGCEDLDGARDEMENRIKEQLRLFADRPSTACRRGSQIRLYFSALAYLLMQARRLGWQETELAKAQCTTLGLKLLKIGVLQ